jgi:CPA1 family monovalent cation:H+ antiporter
LATIVECESLFNDAVAVALYRGVLTGAALWAAGGAIGGVVAGVAFAYVFAALLRRRASARVQIAATIAGAYGSYFAADYLQLSGIFAVIAFGIALRYFERRWITLTIADEVRAFWDVVATVANALVFFLVGAALQIGHLAQEPAFIVACLAAVAVSRVIVAGLLLPCRYPPEWIGVVRVAGMRGALTLALAIALPASTPYREAIVDAAFAVALATIVASALATDRVVRQAVRRREARS